jgi:hypothetical protein
MRRHLPQVIGGSVLLLGGAGSVVAVLLGISPKMSDTEKWHLIHLLILIGVVQFFVYVGTSIWSDIQRQNERNEDREDQRLRYEGQISVANAHHQEQVNRLDALTIKQAALKDFKFEPARRVYEVTIALETFWVKHLPGRPSNVMIGSPKDDYASWHNELQAKRHTWETALYADFQTLGLGPKIVDALNIIKDAKAASEQEIMRLRGRLGPVFSSIPDGIVSLADEIGGIALKMEREAQ